MHDDHLSGWALIVGSAGMIITMAFHPTGRVSPERIEGMIRKLIAVHSLALACIPVLFLGALGLSRHIRIAHRVAVAGLIAYSFALVAVMNAAVADGLILPSVLRHIVESTGSASGVTTWQTISRYNFDVNQAFAQVFVAGSSLALLLWSIAAWQGRELSRALSIYGCILCFAVLGALFSGYLPLDAHRFGAVVLGQTIWFVSAGAAMLGRHNHHQSAAA